MNVMKRASNFRVIQLTLATGFAVLLAACSPSVNPDGTTAVAFVSGEVGRIARACADENFDPSAVRARLIAEGFVEQQAVEGPQLWRFPDGGGPLAQGVTTRSVKPCSPNVNSRFGQESVNAAGAELIAAGFRPTSDPRLLVRGSQQVRLRGRGLEIGGLADIDIELVR